MSYPKSMKDWAEDVHALARKKGWWTEYMVSRDNGRGGMRELSADQVLSKLMLVVSELSEAVECVRDPNFEPRRIDTCDGKPEGFSIELADAVIRIFDLCEAMGIDIEACIREKHYYNQTRPNRHGGKRA